MNNETSSSSEPFRVLIVDDEEDFVRVLLKRLQRRNLDVVSVTGGAEALRTVTDSRFDAVVLDLRMPGMDGMSTLRAIKSSDPGVEVIILTGQAELELARQAMTLGAFDYLLKPPDFDELLHKIQDAASRHREGGKRRMHASAPSEG